MIRLFGSLAFIAMVTPIIGFTGPRYRAQVWHPTRTED